MPLSLFGPEHTYLTAQIKVLKDMVKECSAELKIANQQIETRDEIICLQAEAIRRPEEAASLLERVRLLATKK